MKKQNKIYSASDFVGATSSVLVESCLWLIDNIFATKQGSVSNTPLFIVELKRLTQPDNSSIPEGYTDASAEMEPSRTYYVREGRPLYNDLLEAWKMLDPDEFSMIRNSYKNKLYKGRVERLSGVLYDYTSKHGTTSRRTRMEAWYPDSLDEGRVMDDFVSLCNRGVYVPIIEEKLDPVAEALKNLDPAVIAAIKAMKQ
jgi:hypothetical protein